MQPKVARMTHLQEVLLGEQAVLDFEIQALERTAPDLRQRVDCGQQRVGG